MLEVKTVCVGLEDAIKMYLDQFANDVPEFADKYHNSGKTIGGFVKWISAEALKIYQSQSGTKNGGLQIKDDEVFSLAVSYFEEDDVKEYTEPKKETKQPKPQNKPSAATNQPKVDKLPQPIVSAPKTQINTPTELSTTIKPLTKRQIIDQSKKWAEEHQLSLF